MARTYYGLGPPDIAVAAFDRLAPWVIELLAMQGECRPMGPDYMAVGVALEGLQTAAFHFTRRPHFYFQLESERPAYREGNNRLADREAALTAFDALIPYADALRLMLGAAGRSGATTRRSASLSRAWTPPLSISPGCRTSMAKYDFAGPIGQGR